MLFPRLLPPGSAAPEFTLPDQDGRPFTLSALRGNPVVLVFYPGDETPVCRKQLCELRDQWELFRGKGVHVFGINPKSGASHARFHERHRFPFPLLVDAGQHVAKLYGAKFVWTLRTVYLIDGAGLIRFAKRGKPAPEAVLAAI